jgi:hypothetical protein
MVVLANGLPVRQIPNVQWVLTLKAAPVEFSAILLFSLSFMEFSFIRVSGRQDLNHADLRFL